MTIPIILLLFFTLIEGSRLMFTWSLLADASRVGARLAILSSTATANQVKEAAANTADVIPGLSTSNVTVYHNGTAVAGSLASRVRGDTMKVEISYTFNFLTGKLLPFTSQPIVTSTDMVAEG